MNLNVVELGIVDYVEALAIQKNIMRLRQMDEIGDTLLILSHPHTLTLGRDCRMKKENNIIVSSEYLREKEVRICETNRGGDVTYHGPGQIVGYPIIDLKNHGKDIREYVWKIEEIFIELLKKEFDMTAERNSVNRGVWIGNDKITAIGCSVKKWVTMHGFAFNVNTDLEYFKLINPCGLSEKGVTSLTKLTDGNHDEVVVRNLVIEYFCEVFNYVYRKVDLEEVMQGSEAKNG